MAENRNLFTGAVAQLTRSVHGKLEEYIPVAREVTAKDPEFMAHLVAWNHQKGTIRDAKVALPVASLSVAMSREFVENAQAHLVSLSVRELARGVEFSKAAKVYDRKSRIGGLVKRFLHHLEGNTHRWDRVALQHRDTLKGLYAANHVKPSKRAQDVLFDRRYPAGSIFETVKALPLLPAKELAGVILEKKIPFLVARGACGKKFSEPDVVLALIKAMSPTELVTNAEYLRKLGVENDPALRGAFREAMEWAVKKAPAPMKAGTAARAVKSETMKEAMGKLQEAQLSEGPRIEGSWLVLADKSGSMHSAIAIGREVAGQVARMITGTATLVFFDTQPREHDVTGKTMEQIEAITKFIGAAGGTSIGCGLSAVAARLRRYDGIIVVSDGGHNTAPRFSTVYRAYEKALGISPTVAFLRVKGEPDIFSRELEDASIPLMTFDISQYDGYALPNITNILRAKPYSLIQEIMETPLMTLGMVFGEGQREVA